MARTKHLPKILSLSEIYPLPIKHLSLIGLKLNSETSPAIVVHTNGDSYLAGVAFYKSDLTEAEVMFEEGLDLSILPEAMISTRTMAEATDDALTGFNLEGLAEHVFEAVISLLGEVEIEFNEGDYPDDLKNAEVGFSIVAGRFMGTATRRFSELSSFISKTPSDDD